jgi:hypothetical protein
VRATQIAFVGEPNADRKCYRQRGLLPCLRYHVRSAEDVTGM